MSVIAHPVPLIQVTIKTTSVGLCIAQCLIKVIIRVTPFTHIKLVFGGEDLCTGDGIQLMDTIEHFRITRIQIQIHIAGFTHTGTNHVVCCTISV